MNRTLVALTAVAWCGIAQASVLKTIQIGATDQTITVKVLDAATGVPSTDLAFNSSGIDLEYWRHGANAAVDITEATQTVNGAHSDGGFVHIGAGVYRLDLPDAAVASGATAVDVYGVITGEIVVGGTVQLVSYNPNDSVRLGLTALPNAAADAAGGLPISDAGGLDLDAQIGTDIDAILVDTGTTLQAELDGIQADTEDLQTQVGTDGAGLTNIPLVPANVTQVSGDSGAADALETAFDGTTGPVIPMGIARQGTAQSATGTTLVLDASAPFADDTAIGMTLVACGSTQGYCQSRVVTDYVTSTDTATVETWTVTPSGTITYYLFSTAPGGAGGGLDAAGVRAAVGLASANLDTQLSTIDTEVGVIDGIVDSILADTGTDGVLIAAGEATEIQAAANAALVANHLDHLLAADYDPASKPGTSTALLNELVESDSGVSRFTVNALENGPSGSGASAEAIADEVQTRTIAAVTAVNGFGGTAATAIGDLPTNSELTTALADLPTNAELATALTLVDSAIVRNGVADSGDTNTMVDSALTALYATDDLLIGRYVVRSDSQACFVSDYVAATGTVEFGACIFTGAWSTQGYDIYPAGTQ